MFQQHRVKICQRFFCLSFFKLQPLLSALHFIVGYYGMGVKLVSCQPHSVSSLEMLMLLTSNYSHISVRSEQAQASLQSLQNFSFSSQYTPLMTKLQIRERNAFSNGDCHSLYYSSNRGTWECTDLHGTLLALPRRQMVLGQSQNQNVIFRRNVVHCTSAHI